ncbi:Predicted oxidoreductase [Lachnospiraceae bacterium KHCPX20]|nr:Predicted oxidoreductase [Lachnospiraceae bacterium KHCPX20]
MKLCIGTVQFGMDYGVFDAPKKDPEYCIKCLDFATQNGINAIDTATAYGTAEEITGRFLAKKTIEREKLFISTKLLPNIMDAVEPKDYVKVIRCNLQKSLDTLHTDYVDTFYFHSSRYAFKPELLEAIAVMKKEGLARNVGVSVYYPDEALACFENSNINYIQAPYSIFDHRMREEDVFGQGSKAGFNIDVRTVFIKGLIRLRDSEVPDHLGKARPILRKLDVLCKETGYSRIELAMGYVRREMTINHLVFGVRSLEQLKEDIKSFNKEIPESIFDEIDTEFSGIDADLVVPSLWVK